jgi:hypothetical protein
LLARAFRADSVLHAIQALLHAHEGLNERLVCDYYGLAEDNVQAILDETGMPAGWYPLLEGYDALPPSPDGVPVPSQLAANLKIAKRHHLPLEVVARLKAQLRVLYGAGPHAEARAVDDGPGESQPNEELEEAVLGALIPIPAETFLEEVSQELQSHPISTYWLTEELRTSEGLLSPSEVKRQMEDYVSISILRELGYRWPKQDAYEQEHGSVMASGLVEKDRIIPLVYCRDHLIAIDRVRMRLEHDFGKDGADRSEQEFRKWVGRELGEWLQREFFKRHIQQFRQRPIVWHLTSREGTFQALLLYHGLSRDTLRRIRDVYAGGLLNRLKAELERAQARKDTRAGTELRFNIDDVEEFRDRILAIEEGRQLPNRVRCRWKGEEKDGRPGPYAPDLNDGVKVNIRPFQETGLLAREVIKKW